MNREESLLELLNGVLQLGIGEIRVVRERHLTPCTVHRYRDGWCVLLDHASDREARACAVLGWFFHHLEDLGYFLTGALADRHQNFFLRGERQ